ncbi:putative porin [Pseudomonas aeruginosa]|nr:putative porin [Pseudomonas aeruginosa]
MITASPRPHAWRGYALGLGLLPLAAQAEFLADSSAHLDLRNFYQLRDYRQHAAPQAQAGNWSQGFVLRLQSGFSEGPLGVGLDATGLLGVKLDSGRGRSNDGTLPFGPNSKQPVDDYSHLGLTAKLRHSKTLLQVGILMPQLPVVFRDDMRLLPQTFDGALLTSSEFDGLTLSAGQLWNRAPANRPAATPCTSWAATRPTPATSSTSPGRPMPSPRGSAPATTTVS